MRTKPQTRKTLRNGSVGVVPMWMIVGAALLALAAVLLVAAQEPAGAAPSDKNGQIAAATSSAPRSQGVYRVPYQTGTTVKVFSDFEDHDPPGKVDLFATDGDGGAPYRIVAAADGVIRLIEDGFSEKRGKNANPCNNNYVWIEHPNGEWTKYSHMSEGSVTQDAGLSVGEHVSAGQFLGFEDDVGCANGRHLHFEVAEPIPPVAERTGPVAAASSNVQICDKIGCPPKKSFLDFIDSEGFIVPAKAWNLIPRMCGLPGQEFDTDASYKARSCDEEPPVNEPPIIPVKAPCTITGHNGANELNGTPAADVICGLGGDDTIRGLDGNDVIRGGPGNDTLYGGNGRDQVLGEEGDEIRVHTQDGVEANDLASGGAGTDTCVTDAQDEKVTCP
jgi:murein DD-endopeptidase MepM/ murein hydrolase activator NlpD